MQASSSSSTLLIRGGCLQAAPQQSGFVLRSGMNEAPAARASVKTTLCSPLAARCRFNNSLRTVGMSTQTACSMPADWGHAAGRSARRLYSNPGASRLAE